MNEFNELRGRLRALEREANSMECPDCGGLHQCRLTLLKDWSIVESFGRGLLGDPCFGYKSFVIQRVRDLKMRYNIPLEP